MKCALLFSGGKDSTLAGFLAKQEGHELACLVSVFSENPDSYMFHTPSIKQVEKQAEVMGLPLVVQNSKGMKEEELKDLESVLKKVKKEFGVDCVVTGALKSDYQASRIQKICDDLKLKCLNPLWQIDQIELLEKLIMYKFEVIVVGVAAYGLDESWLGREIDGKFISEVEELERKYQVNPAGEGGEFETFVLNCPLFKKGLKVVDSKVSGGGNSWKLEVVVE